MARTKVFLSYCHRDEDWKRRIAIHLGVLKQQGLLELWCDGDIGVGQDSRAQVQLNLLSAKAAVLLISADFLASDFVLNDDVPRLLEQHEQAGMHLVPVLIRDCAWEAVPWLERLQMLPRDAKPVAELPESQIVRALADVAREVLQLVARP